ncbi:Nucleosome assembly protein 1-like 4 [Anabarilius grahami]|uniref:Nucleosome assembly protein 1-like 4 n=1 Tax=Anabarilius grahami TaxID=495550 RepID=A0A3N0XT44_ANAGA|nr:Nucleosome assembly protein 1-like 4 [Anabarilius grahami]
MDADNEAKEEKTEDANEEKPKGIPEFWLTIFRSVDMLSDMLQVNQQNIRYSTETFSEFSVLF